MVLEVNNLRLLQTLQQLIAGESMRPAAQRSVWVCVRFLQ